MCHCENPEEAHRLNGPQFNPHEECWQRERLLERIARAVDHETETGDWLPLVHAMVAAGYKLKVREL
jgi:hypothetical protein